MEKENKNKKNKTYPPPSASVVYILPSHLCRDFLGKHVYCKISRL